MRSRLVLATAMLVAALLGGCTYTRNGRSHRPFRRLEHPTAPRQCGHGVQRLWLSNHHQGGVQGHEVREVAKVMERTKKADTPHEERRAVAYAVAWIEQNVGEKIGTSADKPGMQFNSSGDPPNKTAWMRHQHTTI